MNKRQAISVAGTLSNPSKMPCKGTSIPPVECKTGGKLRLVEGSTCSDCYACKGRYAMPSVQQALETRFNGLTHPDWVEAMATLIGKAEYFRWHDAGDLQGLWHLANICRVCEATPDTRHWLPTREKGLVLRYSNEVGYLPANLRIRVSAAMIDGNPPKVPVPLGTSGVHDKAPAKGHRCPAPEQDGYCGDCRACWSFDVDHVSYHRH